MDGNSDNLDLIAAIERLGDTEVNDIDDTTRYIVLPSGKSAVSLKKIRDDWATKPDRRKGTATVAQLASFIDHVNRFKSVASAVFVDVVDRKAPRMIGVLDYHPGGGDNTAASFGEHRTVYPFPLSDEWQAWVAASGNAMAQQTFAEFIEERIVDVMVPSDVSPSSKAVFSAELGITLADPARLMALSRGLAIKATVNVKQVIMPSSGETSIVFEEQHGDEGGKPLSVPGGFAIRIPVFRGGDVYPMPVRLKYRRNGPAILWTVSLQRMDAIWDDAIMMAAKDVGEKTALPVFYGRPEA